MLSFYLAMMDTEEDRQFVAQLFDEYQQMMYGITYNILHHKYDAEEAVGNAILNIMESNSLQKMKTFDVKQKESYIAKTAKNAALKIYNKQKKNNENSVNEYYTDSDNIDTTEEEVLSSLTVQEIKSAINELSDNDHNILELYYLHGMSYIEIARDLDITSGNVRQRIHRARKRLIKILEDRGIQNDQ